MQNRRQGATRVALDPRPIARVFRALIAAILLVQLFSGIALGATGFTTLADFPVPGGHFYSQASGQGLNAGFAVVDDDTGLLFTEFDDRGLDPTLAKTRMIPPTGDNSADSKLSWPAVVSRHLAMLDQAPAIRARYFGDLNPIQDYGLPQGIADYGDLQVIRCERAAFQLWRVSTPFAKPGDVTQVNAGDLAKELGLLPPAAALPSAVSSEVVAPPGRMIAPDSATRTAALQVATLAQKSLVRIDVSFNGGIGIASGIVIDRNGDLLTNQHVVDSADAIKVTFGNGVSLAARIIGEDASNDLAVIQVPASAIGPDVVPATMLGGSKLTAGQYVVALGYSPYFASSPAVRLGIYQLTLDGTIAVIRTDSFILPGDSGGMLLDLSGNVVGVNDEIRVTRDLAQPIIGFSIDAAQALRVAQSLLANGSQ